MTLHYEIHVEGLVVNGHPHQLLFTDLHTASRTFDELCKKHPGHEINFYEYTKIPLKKHKPKKKIPTACPRGHEGVTDGRSILSQGTNGLWCCSICGDFFGST